MEATRPKELYRQLDELAQKAFAEADGPRAATLVAERFVTQFGDELGLRSVHLIDERARKRATGANDVEGHHLVHIEALRRSFLLDFEAPSVPHPERLELALSALSSILSTHLLQSAFGGAMRQAEEIQRSLLRRDAAFDGYEIATRCTPAEEVGGDLYDFLPLDEDTLGLAIGDASGHGLPAALLVRDVVVGLRMGMEKDLKAGHVLTRLNQVIHTSSLSSCFVSLFYGELEQNGSLFYFNAGHEPPLLFTEEGQSTLAYGDTVIGPLAKARYKRHFAHVDHGATLVLYTDGLIERRSADGDVFGLERLAETVRASLAGTPDDVLRDVFAAAEGFGDGRPWEDDATLIVLRRDP